jgi:aspartate/methionine/tyrosine aminotransferase
MDFSLALSRRLQDNRDLLAVGLTAIEFEVLPSEGTYFLIAGIGKLTSQKDTIFCERLAREARVALIPLSVFFEDGTPGNYVRFAFCKQRALVEEALVRLTRYFGPESGKP